jgi:hypothetical protein
MISCPSHYCGAVVPVCTCDATEETGLLAAQIKIRDLTLHFDSRQRTLLHRATDIKNSRVELLEHVGGP